MINVDLHQPEFVSSLTYPEHDHRSYKFATLTVSGVDGSSINIFLKDNAASFLQAIKEESEKILDFLYDGEVSLDQSTEGKTK